MGSSSQLIAARQRTRILVVEADAAMRSVVARSLERDGTYEVTLLGDGAEALALVRAGQQFDLVIAELRNPSMIGTELRKRLSAIDPLLATRVGFVTEHASDALAATGAHVLLKPFTGVELRTWIAGALEDLPCSA